MANNSNVKINYTQLYINGEFINSSDNNKLMAVENPATEEILAYVQTANHNDVDYAVGCARSAFDYGPWRKLSAYDRGQLLFKFAALLEANASHLANLNTLECGKCLRESIGEIRFAVQVFRYYAGFCDKIQGSTIPVSGDYECITKKEPIGVCG